MKRQGRFPWNSVLMVLGFLLIIGAVALMVLGQISQGSAAQRAEALVREIRRLTPPVHRGTVYDRANTAMAAMEVEGMDFVAILDIPGCGRELPVFGHWETGKIPSFPCRYTGSIYDGSLIIGGSDNAGQFDFMKVISISDSVSITDMTGARYGYTVTDIRVTRDVSTGSLRSQDADLVLFARNTATLDYTLVLCQLN